MSKLTDSEETFLRLVLRSKDAYDGWRNVSQVVWPLVLKFQDTRPELVDVKPFDMATDKLAGRVRLTERGRIVAEYLL